MTLQHDPAVVELMPRLSPWANQIASRFGRPVYLTGSSLELCDPRDVDIRVILTTEEFAARWGDPKEWMQGLWTAMTHGATKYAADMYKLRSEACLGLRLNVDFQVQPPVEAIRHLDMRKHRVDTLLEVEPLSNEQIMREVFGE